MHSAPDCTFRCCTRTRTILVNQFFFFRAPKTWDQQSHMAILETPVILYMEDPSFVDHGLRQIWWISSVERSGFLESADFFRGTPGTPYICPFQEQLYVLGGNDGFSSLSFALSPVTTYPDVYICLPHPPFILVLPQTREVVFLFSMSSRYSGKMWPTTTICINMYKLNLNSGDSLRKTYWNTYWISKWRGFPWPIHIHDQDLWSALIPVRADGRRGKLKVFDGICGMKWMIPIGSMYGIYANIKGVSWWDPCYHI